MASFDFDDNELAVAILNALQADHKTAEAIIRSMVRGCEEIARFERAMATIREVNVTAVSEACDEARDSFGSLIDIFGDLLDIVIEANADGDA